MRDQFGKRFLAERVSGRSVLLWLLAALPFLATLFVAMDAWARPGGGGNYTGGGGSLGSGGGGGDGIGILIYLVFAYPEVGVPVAVIVIVASVIKRARNPDRTTARAVERLEQVAPPDLGALSGIKSRDPGFDGPSFLERITKMQNALNDAWCRGEMSPVRTFLSDGLMRRFETQLAIMKHQGVRNAMADHQLLGLTIHAASHDAHFDTIHVLLRASARDVEVDASFSYDEAQTRAAKASQEEYSEVWSFLRRPGVQTGELGGAFEGRCPNCGAPLETGQATRCEHCQALVNSGEYDWVLAEITQLEEWRPGSTGRIDGLAALEAADPGFNRQVAEDRGSYLFWRWVEALVRGDAKPLVKVASPDFRQTVAEQTKNGAAALYKVAVGGVDLVACEAGGENGRDRYYLKILWSSARASKAQPAPAVNILAVSRQTGAHDTGGFSYARCANCQAPLSENDAPTCDYCGTDLAAGDADWVLDNVLQPEELRVQPVATAAAAVVHGQPGLGAPDMGDKRERTLLLMRMAAVVVADGIVTKEERKLLKSAAKRWQVPIEAVDPILNGQVEPEVAMTMRPSNPRAFVSGLVSAALVDGKIDKKEERLLVDVGQSLGLASQQIRNIMKEMGG